MAFVYTDITC